jgi:hypothetical protein
LSDKALSSLLDNLAEMNSAARIVEQDITLME